MRKATPAKKPPLKSHYEMFRQDHVITWGKELQMMYTENILQEYIDKYYDETGEKPDMPLDEMTGKEVEAGDEYIAVGEDAEDLRHSLVGASFFSVYELERAEKALMGGKAKELSEETLYKIGNALFEMRLELYRLNQMVC